MYMLDFLNKIMPFVIILWIIALITLGVVSHYAQKDIDNQGAQSRRSGIPSAIWERMGGCDYRHPRCIHRQ